MHSPRSLQLSSKWDLRLTGTGKLKVTDTEACARLCRFYRVFLNFAGAMINRPHSRKLLIFAAASKSLDSRGGAYEH
jgi:hypothetical protein